MNDPKHSVWRVPVRISDIPAGGRHLDLHADAATREAIAGIAALEALPRLEASFDISREGGDAVRVQGVVSASVRQACVVTLEPIDSDIEEAVEVIFAPGAGGLRSEETFSGVELSLAVEEEREPLEGDTIDLGQIATEHLILAIDPYPRKPGAVFTAPELPAASDNPFAALAALKTGKAEQ